MKFLDRLIAQQTANGFQEFAGAEVSGRIPLRQTLLNAVAAEALRGKSGTLSGATLVIVPGNVLSVTLHLNILLLKQLRVDVTLPKQVDFRRDPVMRLQLGGPGGMLARLGGILFSGKFPEGVTMSGDLATIDVRRLLTSRGMGQYFPLLQTLGFETQNSILSVNFKVGVPAPKESNPNA